MKKLIKYLSILGLAGFLFSCQKQETKTEIAATIIKPTITLPATMSYVKSMAGDMVTIRGTRVNPGYQASATYYLEVDTAGDNFTHAVTIANGVQDTLFTFTVSALNGALLSSWNPYVPNHLEFRVRAVFDQSNAGAGVPSIVSISPTDTITATLYGLPQLNLVGTTVPNQTIQSINSDGNYSGYVKLVANEAFTLFNPITDTTYGAGTAGGTIAVNGTGLSATKSGWYLLTVNTNTSVMSESMPKYMPGMIGSFQTLYGQGVWSNPDYYLDYAKKGNFWYTTVKLEDGGTFKFQFNDIWGSPGSGLNGGLKTEAAFVPGVPLTLNNASNSTNIDVPAAGTYYVTLAGDIFGAGPVATFTLVSSK